MAETHKHRNTTKTGQDTISTDFDGIRLSVASPEHILAWSYGEVTKPETINYRTQKPERDGLFDERIFGPVKDYECYCGKYKKIRYKGIVCDRCGVEVTRSAVRRERMGHIDLSVPVMHIWYLYGTPSVLSTILDISIDDLESIIYFAAFVILQVDDNARAEALHQLEAEYSAIRGRKDLADNVIALTKAEAIYKASKAELNGLAIGKTISEAQYHELSLRYGQVVKVGIGAEAVLTLLEKVDIDGLIKELTEKISTISDTYRRKYIRRLRLLSDMKKAKIKPHWLVMQRLPVISPDLRPMVQLDGGRFATSDLNDLYRRVLNRNNRLKRLIKQGAPEVICRNEKRMLQEAVDALIDNSARRGRAATVGTARKLRSLSDILRGKQGRFRQNLLGKRVDYSGRSVIVIGPKLKLHQCGLPKVMAIELFKTFVISKLINDGYVHNVKNASRMIERREPVVWDILEQVTSEYHVMLNRAPTLHRLGIQAFQPVLIEGKAIQIHPSVCYAFNADFDGDQMAVHVPLSVQAREEAKSIMLSTKNLLKPASGEPVISPRLDIVLGCYYLTTLEENNEKPVKIFASKNEAIMSYQQGNIGLRSKILVRIADEVAKTDFEPQPIGKRKLITTSIGRILFNNILPDSVGYHNITLDSSALKKVVALVFKVEGGGETALLVDRINQLGFRHATLSGTTISMADIYTPSSKPTLMKEAEATVAKINTQYRQGLITAEERRVRAVEVWLDTKDKIEKAMIEGFDKESPVWTMVSSGARGSVTQLLQMSGMKGNVVNPAGKIIELPIKSNYKEGLTVLEYFNSTHGSRKGKSDTALRTSDAGYLTRRLVDVAQDIVVNKDDCGTTEYITISKDDNDTKTFADKAVGRTVAKALTVAGKTLLKKGEIISTNKAQELAENKDVKEVNVRSVIHCRATRGICAACYGNDMATGELVKHGTTVGIIAAQAIGEPGTQLTMKTFHLGGVTGVDITSGLPRVEEVFEARSPRTPAVVSEVSGIADIVTVRGKKIIRVTSSQKASEDIVLPEEYKLEIENGDYIKPRQVIASAEGKRALRATVEGLAKIKGQTVTISSSDLVCQEYDVPQDLHILVEKGDKVEAGEPLTEGHLDLNQSLRLRGAKKTQDYIINEVNRIYVSQGQEISDKHVELIVRQMFSKVQVVDEGTTELVPGQLIDRTRLEKINRDIKKAKGEPAQAADIVLGITRVALRTESFLSAASFQETTNVLIDAATRGAVDRLQGLKENVIIGKLIPAGTGYNPDDWKENK